MTVDPAPSSPGPRERLSGRLPRMQPALLRLAGVALARVLTLEHPADSVLSRFFREHPDLGGRDRAFVAEAVFAVLRARRSLERWAGDDSPRHLLLAAVVRMFGLSQRELAPALSREQERWIAERRAQPALALSPAEQADLPDWLYERLAAVHDAERLTSLVRSLKQPAPLDVRANPLKATRAEVLARLADEGFKAQAGRFAPHAIRLMESAQLARHPLFLEGALEVQDEGSQIVTHLVAPRRGEMVVDFCAGAGGKTLLLGALMRSSGRLYAFDVSDKRLARLRRRVARAGLSNVHPVCLHNEQDARVKRLAGKIDRVLVDAPCSGTGTLRRNPDLKWRQTPADIVELVQKQRAILAAAARLLKPGGRLVYVTCSLLADENEAVADAFLAEHPAFVAEDAWSILDAQGIRPERSGAGPYLMLAPDRHQCDGFFAAVFSRRTLPTAADA